MSIVEIVKILTSAGIEQNEANAEVKMLIEHFCGYSAIDIVMGKRLDESKLNLVREKAQLRARTRMPIQHILGFSYFMGDKFKVSKDTLIPRDETEILARKAIDIIKKKYHLIWKNNITRELENIFYLAIETEPGVCFKINTSDNDEPQLINSTGVLVLGDLDVKELIYVNKEDGSEHPIHALIDYYCTVSMTSY